MRSMFETNLRTSGKEFTVERTDQHIRGIIIYDQNCIDIPKKTDLMIGDIVKSEKGSRYQIVEIRETENYDRYIYKTV